MVRNTFSYYSKSKISVRSVLYVTDDGRLFGKLVLPHCSRMRSRLSIKNTMSLAVTIKKIKANRIIIMVNRLSLYVGYNLYELSFEISSKDLFSLGNAAGT